MDKGHMGILAAFSRMAVFVVFSALLLAPCGSALADDADQTGDDAVAQAAPEASADPEVDSGQKTYPGVKNLVFKSGTPNEPHVSIYYPAFGNEKVDAIMRDFATAQGEDYERDIRESFAPDEEKPDTYEMWEMTGLYTISERPSPHIVSVTFNIYSYTGGAHGNILIRCLNADLSTGKLLEFSDLFGDPQKALEILSSVSEKKLRAELGEEADEEMIRGGASAELNNFLNLSLNPKGLSVEFQPYQVGPWSIGVQKTEVSLEDLAEARPSPAVWSALPAPKTGDAPVEPAES